MRGLNVKEFENVPLARFQAKIEAVTERVDVAVLWLKAIAELILPLELVPQGNDRGTDAASEVDRTDHVVVLSQPSQTRLALGSFDDRDTLRGDDRPNVEPSPIKVSKRCHRAGDTPASNVGDDLRRGGRESGLRDVRSIAVLAGPSLPPVAQYGADIAPPEELDARNPLLNDIDDCHSSP
jgi:hypothetical protein